MNEYMVRINFFSVWSTEFISLIPAQRNSINALMEKGIITSCSLSTDRHTMWLVILSDTRDSVKNILAALPLSGYMLYDIKELMFHISTVGSSIKLSMN
jgi:muconolactone delta-isomerase